MPNICEQLRAKLAIQQGQLFGKQTDLSQVAGQRYINQVTLANLLKITPQTPQLQMQEQQLQQQIQAADSQITILTGEFTAAQSAVVSTQADMRTQGCP